MTETHHTPEGHLTAAQVAAIFRISRKTLHRRAAADGLAPIKQGGTVLYRRADLEAITGGHTDLLTVTEVTAILAISRETLRQWTGTGVLPVVQVSNGHWRVPRAAVEALTGGHADLMPPREAARLLFISPRSLRRWAPHLQAVTLPTGGRRYPRSAVQALIEERVR